VILGLPLMEDAIQRKGRRLPPVHPGEILREDMMTPLGISINRLGRDLRVPVTRMSEIVNGRRSITADTALRLGRYLGTIWTRCSGLQPIGSHGTSTPARPRSTGVHMEGTVGIRIFRDRLTRYVARVRRGHRVRLHTESGRPRACHGRSPPTP
jgi:addiction module HigA family antidote